MQKVFVFPLAWVLGWLLFSGCDSEKFFGYNYDADQISEFVNISGRITNIFTGTAVKEAQVSIGGQSALTDSTGNYLLSYLLGSDEEFNRSIPVTITAEKYHVLDTSVVIFPIENIFNARLIYGAPIILESFRNENRLFRATILDYQGISDIQMVLVYGWYRDPVARQVFQNSSAMELVEVFDAQRGLYEGRLPNSIEQGGLKGWLLPGRHIIEASDKSGFFERMVFIY